MFLFFINFSIFFESLVSAPCITPITDYFNLISIFSKLLLMLLNPVFIPRLQAHLSIFSTFLLLFFSIVIVIFYDYVIKGALSRASSINSFYFTSQAVLYLFFSSSLIYFIFWIDPLSLITFYCISAFHWLRSMRSRTRWGLIVTAYIVIPCLMEMLLGLISAPGVFPNSKDAI